MADRGDTGSSCDESYGTQGFWDIYIQDSEHGVTVHRYSPNSGHMNGYGDESGIADTNEVVGEGGTGIRRESVKVETVRR